MSEFEEAKVNLPHYAGHRERLRERFRTAGDEAIAKLSHARHLVLKGQGHAVLSVGCMPKLFAQFVEKADPKALDAKCLDNLDAVPPFTSFNGWTP